MRTLLALILLASPLFTAPTPAAAPITLVAFGDSLTAGYRLARADAFPARLEKALRAKGWSVKIINAGVSGDTTKAGLARLNWAVPKTADAVIVELGANDGLRGVDPNQTRTNLDKIVSKLRQRDLEVLIAGMVPPATYGEDYAKRFASLFPDLAKKHDAIHYPFFLKGVALRPELNQSDGMHPTAKGIDIIVANILPSVEKLLTRVKTRQAAN